MKNLWEKFNTLTAECYMDMVRVNSGMEVWDACYNLLLTIISQGRETDAAFAPELYCLDEDTDYEYDVENWLEDYLDELDMADRYADLESVCRKLLTLFAWKEEDPSDLYFRISAALGSQGKKEEALAYCEEWYKQDSGNMAAAAALIYVRIGVRDWAGAEDMVKRYIADDMVCTDENEIIFVAASALYKDCKNKKAEKKINKALETYEREIEEYFMGMDEEELEFAVDYDSDEEDLPFR